MKVAEELPLKQGLKLTLMCALTIINTVAEELPLKQGLKPPTALQILCGSWLQRNFH